MHYMHHWPWFIASLVTAIIAAYAYIVFQQPVYKIEATLLIKDKQNGLDNANGLKELDFFTSKKVVENEIEILKSYTLMRKVVTRFDLNTHYYFDSRFGKREIFVPPVRLIADRPNNELYKEELVLTFPAEGKVAINNVVYPINRHIQTPYGRLRIASSRKIPRETPRLFISVHSRNSAIRRFVKVLNAKPTSKASSVIQLSIEDVLPQRGEAILNQLIVEYNQAAIADKSEMAANTLKFIEERLGLISQELASVEKDVENFKTSNRITDLSAQSQIFLTTVQQNDSQLSQVEIQISALNDVETYLKSQAKNKGIAPATLGMGDPTMLNMVNTLSEMELKREQLVRTTPETNQLVQTIDSQIAELRLNILENVGTLKKQLQTSQKQLVANNNRIENMVRNVPGRERILLDISRQQVVKNDLYTYLLQKREETAVTFASTISESRTVDVADHDDEPVKPIERNIYLIFFLVGLILPVAFISAFDALNNKVHQRHDVEVKTSTPILGELMKSKQLGPIIIESGNYSILSEQIRTLRTNLQFLRSNSSLSQVLLFTSSISGEGKSFISLNLGASFALTGKSVVILDMDLRKPKLHKVLGFDNKQGISSYLASKLSIQEVIQAIPGGENYFIICSGPIPPNPSELLGTERLVELINGLKKIFDYVIIDSPPIGLVADAQIIAPLADSTMYIVRHNYTLKNHIRMVDEYRRENRFNRLNIIINAVQNDEGYYYNNGYKSYDKKSYYTEESSKLLNVLKWIRKQFI